MAERRLVNVCLESPPAVRHGCQLFASIGFRVDVSATAFRGRFQGAGAAPGCGACRAKARSAAAPGTGLWGLAFKLHGSGTTARTSAAARSGAGCPALCGAAHNRGWRCPGVDDPAPDASASGTTAAPSATPGPGGESLPLRGLSALRGLPGTRRHGGGSRRCQPRRPDPCCWRRDCLGTTAGHGPCR